MAANSFANASAGNRMRELRERQQQRQQEQFRLTKEPHFGAPRSGFQNEHDYLDALNEDSELANLQSLDAGRGLAQSSANYGIPGLRGTRPGVGQLSLTGQGSTDMVEQQRAQQSEDPIDKATRQAGADLLQQGVTRGRMQIDQATSDQYDRAAAATAPRGKRALDLGYTADAAGKYGDIDRGESLKNAQAGATEFLDPHVREARKLEVDEQERLLDARYGKQADAAAKIEAARIAAGARTDSAGITAGGGLTREAIRGLLKSRELNSLTGQPLDPQQQQSLEDLMWRQAHGQQPGMGPGDEKAGYDPPPTIDSLLADVNGNQNLVGGYEKLKEIQNKIDWSQLTPDEKAQITRGLGIR